MSQDDINKYKILFEVSKHEYQLEIDRSKSLDEKAIKYSTMIGIVIVAYSAALTKLETFTAYACTSLTKWILYILCIILFITILSSWYKIAKVLSLSALEKVPLDDSNLTNTFINTDERTCLWYMGEIYQDLILRNATMLKDKVIALEKAYSDINCAAAIFSILCLYLLILYLTGECNVQTYTELSKLYIKK
ncbi:MULTISPECIES: hypothetical protein [Acinetobacter calcoaceticus/baumannii complex]|uniref:hypothetical protein n=1 Tax=Acinetobacter calcoaceticus/baumannii complex TaxID=909768 RepID=UPI0004495A4D|nr:MULTISPECIES: hypothetical protein [Acinetobacter calcoaceticus/baumannii complex]EXR40920.1 hypothetical protein J655_2679 [Acinetobacter sp. 1294243]KQG41300.1 hypothetical protein APC39_10320 [Acinetobacter pittii]OCY16356.1 hypothetical protein BFR62_18275 [Acinetobacter pittii]